MSDEKEKLHIKNTDQDTAPIQREPKPTKKRPLKKDFNKLAEALKKNLRRRKEK